MSCGGQLGDTWPQRLAFIERVVSGHPGNPLVIFPQSLHFRDQGRLRMASATRQAQPGLTLMLRDHLQETGQDPALDRLALFGFPLVSHRKLDLFQPLVAALWRKSHARMGWLTHWPPAKALQVGPLLLAIR